MNKLSRILFLLVGCIMPIFIGIVHTIVYFTQLTAPEIENHLQKQFEISGSTQPLWYSWGVVSFMMGISFIVIGLLNSYILQRNSKHSALPTLPIIAMLFYQLCVIYVGYEYEQNFQFYGGIFGLLLLLICIFLNAKKSKLLTSNN